MKKLHKRFMRTIKVIGAIFGALCTLLEFSTTIMLLIVQANQI